MPLVARSVNFLGSGKSTEGGGGESEKDSPPSGCPVALSAGQRYTGTRPLASDGRNSKSNDFWKNEMNQQFVICIGNDEYPASLERRKLYEVVPDADAESIGQLRVKDESGEDYLYPKELFVTVDLPSSTEKAVQESKK